MRCISERTLVLSSKQTIFAVCLQHRIPAMVDHSAGDLPIFESGAIMWYLGTQHDPQGKLYPKASICNTNACGSGLELFGQRPVRTLPSCIPSHLTQLQNSFLPSSLTHRWHLKDKEVQPYASS